MPDNKPGGQEFLRRFYIGNWYARKEDTIHVKQFPLT
jgi:hypothetical protein